MPDNNKILQLYRQLYEKPVMSEQDVFILKQRIKQGKEERRIMLKRKARKRSALAVTAAVILSILILPNISRTIAYAMRNIPILGDFFKVITFRDYQYGDEKNKADVVLPEIKAEERMNSSTAKTAKKTADEINAEIREIANKWIEEFKTNMKEEGYHNIKIDAEIVTTTENYFTLKLVCFKSAGSGYEENYFYTIDLNTGERVKLADLFKEGSDYKRVISENIKQQMRQQMAADDSIIYWVDEKEFPEWNFDQIADDTSFYINENGEIVICFNEGEVAPAYMGAVEFTIPKDVVADILK